MDPTTTGSGRMLCGLLSFSPRTVKGTGSSERLPILGSSRCGLLLPCVPYDEEDLSLRDRGAGTSGVSLPDGAIARAACVILQITCSGGWEGGMGRAARGMDGGWDRVEMGGAARGMDGGWERVEMGRGEGGDRSWRGWR